MQNVLYSTIKTAHGSAAHNIYGVFNRETIKASGYAPVFVNDVLFWGEERKKKKGKKTPCISDFEKQIQPLIQSCTIKSYLGEQPWWGAESLGLTQICPCPQMVPR